MSDGLFERLENALAPAFRLDRELKGGGMSRVFVATEQALGRRVVIKLLPPELAAGVNSERFRREIQLAAQLHHPHIVPLLAAGEIDGLLYYTMPFIEGESLRERLAARGPFPVRDVVRMMHDVVDALAYAHARGIVHRDIKPGNILTLGAHALVTDFGVAKAISVALPISGVTTGGVAIGTPAYMAPEQLAGDPNADHRMDIYAAGLLAYELLAGESPFTGSSPQATMAAQLTRVPEPVDTIRSDVPAPLASIITRCLQKSPEARYPAADELLADLDGVDTLQATTALTPAADVPSRRERRIRAALLGGALAAAAAGGMAANALLSPNEEAALPVALDTVGADLIPPVVMRDTVQTTVPAAPPRTLSRAESLAIARAIREQVVTESPPTRPQEHEALAVQIERMVADSIRRLLMRFEQIHMPEVPLPPGSSRPRAAPATSAPDAPVAGVLANPQLLVRVPDGQRVVAVANLSNATGQRELASVALALSDSLRVAIDRRDHFVLVPAGGTASIVSGSRGEVTVMAGGPAFTVSGMLLIHDGQVSQLVRINDSRGQLVGMVHGPLSPRDQPLAGAGELTQLILAQLDQLARSDGGRRTPLVSTSPSRTRP